MVNAALKTLRAQDITINNTHHADMPLYHGKGRIQQLVQTLGADDANDLHHALLTGS